MEPLARLPAATTGAADDIERIDCLATTRFKDRGRIQLIERDVSGNADVNLPKFDWRADVDQFKLTTAFCKDRKFMRFDGCNVHSLLLVDCGHPVLPRAAQTFTYVSILRHNDAKRTTLSARQNAPRRRP